MKMLAAWFLKTEIVTKTESWVTRNFCFDFFDFISWVVEWFYFFIIFLKLLVLGKKQRKKVFNLL